MCGRLSTSWGEGPAGGGREQGGGRDQRPQRQQASRDRPQQEPRVPRDVSGLTCHNCLEKGHIMKDCTKRSATAEHGQERKEAVQKVAKSSPVEAPACNEDDTACKLFLSCIKTAQATHSFEAFAMGMLQSSRWQSCGTMAARRVLLRAAIKRTRQIQPLGRRSKIRLPTPQTRNGRVWRVSRRLP